MIENNILPWTRAVLSTTPERWLTLAQTLPQELLARSRSMVGHSLPPTSGDAERLVFPARVRYLLAGQVFPALDPNAEATKPWRTSPPYPGSNL